MKNKISLHTTKYCQSGAESSILNFCTSISQPSAIPGSLQANLYEHIAIMNILFSWGLLLTLVSCGQNANNNITNQATNTLVTKANDKNLTSNSTNEASKHDTFNENIDTIPEVLKVFVPTGYSVLNLSTGDADLDGLIDKILVLRKNTEETTSNYADDKPDKRPLLLLLGQRDNSYKLEFRNDNAVYCIDCGGVFGDPFTGTTIKNGYFSIEHSISGGRHWEQVIIFKFDKSTGNWFLHKDHYISRKLNGSEDENAEALAVDVEKLETVKDFGMLSFDKFNIYNDNGR